MGIGKKIKACRQAARLSQQLLADALGVKQSTVAAWEAGRNQPDPEMIKAIGLYCKVSADYLIGMPPTTNADLPADIKALAEKLANLSSSDRSIIEKVIDAMNDVHGHSPGVPSTHRNG